MKKILLSAACVAAFGAAPAVAQDSPWDISGTFGVTSDYMFRGLSQTSGKAALQAGATVSHDSGFYVGVWGSNVDFSDSGDNITDFEVDWYVGYGGAIDEATSFDVNLTYYSYPNSPSGSDYGYFELGAGVTYQVDDNASVGLKAAYSPENFGDTGNAFWLGANATFGITEWLSASANVGYQWLDENYGDDYFHYDVGATVSYGILDIDLRYIGTDINGGDDKIVGSASFNF